MQYHLKTNGISFRSFIWLLLVLLSSGMAYAQNFKATGTVLDNEGEPLIGATVAVVGTNKAVVTDLDGNFSIDVALGKVLQFRYVGYKTQNYQVKTKSPITVKLESEDYNLDEVVVTALGISREARLFHMRASRSTPKA